MSAPKGLAAILVGKLSKKPDEHSAVDEKRMCAEDLIKALSEKDPDAVVSALTSLMSYADDDSAPEGEPS